MQCEQNMCQTVNIHLQKHKSTSFFFSQVSNSPNNEINIIMYFQGVFYAIVIYGLVVLRVCYGSLPVFLCNIAGFLKGCSIMFGAVIIATNTFTRFMFVCIWKRMRQMDDNLIVRIATIQAIFMCLLIQAATWLQLQRQPTIPVSFLRLKLQSRQSKKSSV